MFYVYIIRSHIYPKEIYVGFTEDLKIRVGEHNAGKSIHTSKFRPWKLISYFAFDSEVKARAFEKYLKSGSGRAFRKKHL